MNTYPTTSSSGANIVATDWGWQYYDQHRPAVHDITIGIDSGERVLVLGPSGSGKSTMLGGFAGLLSSESGQESGQLLIDGTHPRQQRHRIGMVLQDPDSQVILSRVGDDIAFGMENFGVPPSTIWPRVQWALHAVGLRVALSEKTSTLSGGQKQRLALAGVLAMHPGLLVLDEPTANLDPAGVIEVRNAVTAVAELTGATVIIIEHRTATWLPVVDRVIIMNHSGEIVCDGPPEKIIQQQQTYLMSSGIWVPHAQAPNIRRNPAHEIKPLLKADNLAVGYHRHPPVRSNINCAIGQGRVTTITGPNGTGKSTLALTLAGLLPPRGGTLSAHYDIAVSQQHSRHSRHCEPIRWRSKELLTRIASVFQNPEHQFLTGTVREEICLGPKLLKYNDAVVKTRCDELLDKLGLTHIADRNPYTLCGGEKRRLSVATALATRPHIIILDEPTFGQDRRTWTDLLTLLAEIANEGTAVVAITHDEEFVDLLADDRIELDVIHT